MTDSLVSMGCLPRNHAARLRRRLGVGALGVVVTLVLIGASCADAASGGAAPTVPAPAVVELPARPGLALSEPRAAVTRDGLYRMTWRPSEGFVPINEPFELEVTVARNDETRAPIADAEVVVTCEMPAHGHGMLREPRSEVLGEGRYRVRGMLLHMGGHWTVAVTVLVDGVASTADDALDL